jgi:hypothetical protein
MSSKVEVVILLIATRMYFTLLVFGGSSIASQRARKPYKTDIASLSANFLDPWLRKTRNKGLRLSLIEGNEPGLSAGYFRVQMSTVSYVELYPASLSTRRQFGAPVVFYRLGYGTSALRDAQAERWTAITLP